MKNDLLNINVRAGAKGKVAELSLLANDTKAMMDVLHGALVEVGRWLDIWICRRTQSLGYLFRRLPKNSSHIRLFQICI